MAASQTTPAGETWYIYMAGGGNSDARSSYALTTFVIAPFVQEVQARAMTDKLSTDAPCGDPPWLARGLAEFKLGQCDVRDWDMVDLNNLPDGNKHLEGMRVSVDYAVADPARVPPGMVVQRNFRAALGAIGATLVSAPDDEERVVATQATPAGETWYIYTAGGGNSDARTSFTLTTLVVGPFVQEVQAQAMADGVQAPGKDCTDPPWLVRQFANFRLSDCGYQDFAPLTVKLPDGERTLAGRMLETHYTLADPHHDRIEVASWRNYVEALKAVGATLVSDPQDTSVAVLRQKVGEGEYWYVYRKGGANAEATGDYSLITLQVGGPPPKSCKLEVYGVNFDFDKSVLPPDSEPVLQQVLALFVRDPKFGAEVGGHTDNVGQPTYNQKLSEARAAAVKAWLVAHGAGAAQVTSRGYGDTQPLVPNTTDANRFKNRRVELKRNNCQ